MIREVTLRRFKQFANVTLPLDGHVVLAGQNNSGKTTVLQALSAWRLLDDFSRQQTIDFDDYSSVESTVVVLVVVECDEIFSVIDLETSKLLQGHADNKVRRVKHVVRLEQVVNWVMHDTQGFYVESGPWKITDWDDMLKGNNFFLDQ